MKNRFDKIAKQIGEEALSSSGATFVQDEINTETLYADLRHQPDPARQAERARLGLLGRLAAAPCLIEVYSRAPNAEEFRSCLLCRMRHNRHYADRRIMPTSYADSTVTPVGYAA